MKILLSVVFIIISSFILTSCYTDNSNTSKSIKQESSSVQQHRAKEAFDELDKETSTNQPIRKEEKPAVPEKKVDTIPLVPKTVQEKPAPTKVIEKEKPKENKYPFQDGKPIWFFEPNYDGYLGAVGTAKKDAAKGGYGAQRKLALVLAQAELSKQIKVVVNSSLTLERTRIQTSVYDYYHSKLSTLSRHQSEELIKNAVVKDEFIHRDTGELSLWVVIEK